MNEFEFALKDTHFTPWLNMTILLRVDTAYEQRENPFSLSIEMS